MRRRVRTIWKGKRPGGHHEPSELHPLLAHPITVFDVKGIPATRRERIQAAVEAGGRDVTAPHEAWFAGPNSPTASPRGR
jgi:hypothetical protein